MRNFLKNGCLGASWKPKNLSERPILLSWSRMLEETLSTARELRVRQRHELAELFGFETRNKYEIQDDSGRSIGFAAEQGKGLGQIFGRMFLGHWREFEVHVFNTQRQLTLRLLHPFRWFFQRIEVFDAGARFLGALQQRFGILHTYFDVEDAKRETPLKVVRRLWHPWTFHFLKKGETVAIVRKRWSGFFTEAFTDSDNFTIHFERRLTAEERQLVLAAAFFIDINYFEKKAEQRD